MPRAAIKSTGRKTQCSVCKLSPARLKQLHEDFQNGAKPAELARRYDRSGTSMHRHFAAGHHDVKRPSIITAVETGQAPDLSTLKANPHDDEDAVLRKLTDLQKIAEALLARAAGGGGTVDVSLRCIRTTADLLSLRVDLEGKLREARVRHVVDLRLSAAFGALRQAAAQALAPYPEAAAALSAALLRALPEAHQ